MELRRYQQSDCEELTELFYNTVHTVNAKDYTKEQLDVWATGQADLAKWNQSLQEHYSVVAVENGVIVGFGDIDKTGYLDRLYVHADYQGRGIATAICNQLERAVQGDITTHASITEFAEYSAAHNDQKGELREIASLFTAILLAFLRANDYNKR